jgi:hypothetical protein
LLHEKLELIPDFVALANEAKSQMDVRQLTSLAAELLKGLYLLIAHFPESNEVEEIDTVEDSGFISYDCSRQSGTGHCDKFFAGACLAELLHSLGFIPIAQVAQFRWASPAMRKLMRAPICRRRAATCQICLPRLLAAMTPLCTLFKIIAGEEEVIPTNRCSSPIPSAFESSWAVDLRQITRITAETMPLVGCNTPSAGPPPLQQQQQQQQQQQTAASDLQEALSRLPAVTARVSAAHALAAAAAADSYASRRGGPEAAGFATRALNRLDHSRQEVGPCAGKAGRDAETGAVTTALLMDPEARIWQELDQCTQRAKRRTVVG